MGSTSGNKACSCLYCCLRVSTRSSSGSSGPLSDSSFLDPVDGLAVRGGAVMKAGWEGIWEDGLWDLSAIAAR